MSSWGVLQRGAIRTHAAIAALLLIYIDSRKRADIKRLVGLDSGSHVCGIVRVGRGGDHIQYFYIRLDRARAKLK